MSGSVSSPLSRCTTISSSLALLAGSGIAKLSFSGANRRLASDEEPHMRPMMDGPAAMPAEARPPDGLRATTIGDRTHMTEHAPGHERGLLPRPETITSDHMLDVLVDYYD